jgi:hypothetical protein
MSSAEELINWIDSVLTPEAKIAIAHQVKADTAMSQPLIKQLQALRAQLRENAYQKIFEARANVADDLLKLTTSLTQLIHFSNVAGEDTTAYITLFRQVSAVTQKLSVFGEDDANGDGLRDSVEEGPGRAGPDSDLELDGQGYPSGKSLAPKDQQHDEGPTEDPDVNPDDVKPEDAPTSDKGATEAEPVPEEEPSGDDAEMTEDESGVGDESAEEPKESFNEDFDNLVKNLPKEKAAPKEERPAEEAPADEGEAPEDEAEPIEEDGEDGKDKGKKKGFLDQIGEGETAESSVALAADESKFRFAYLGIEGKAVSALVSDSIYQYKPTKELFGGSIEKLDVALRKLLANQPGYTAVLNKLNELVRAKKIVIAGKRTASDRELRISLGGRIDKGQLGEVDPEDATPWRYRGVGLQKVKNNEACIWFEVGSKEYAAVPNPKSMKPGEDLDDFSDKIAGKLKSMSYAAGLEFLLGMVKRGFLKPLFVGPIG